MKKASVVLLCSFIVVILAAFLQPVPATASPSDSSQNIRRVKVTITTTSQYVRLNVPVGETIYGAQRTIASGSGTGKNDNSGITITNYSPGSTLTVSYKLLTTDGGIDTGTWKRKNWGSYSGGSSTITVANIKDINSERVIFQESYSTNDGVEYPFEVNHGDLDCQYDPITGDKLPETCGLLPQIETLQSGEVQPSKDGTGKRVLASYLAWWSATYPKWSNGSMNDLPLPPYKISGVLTNGEPSALDLGAAHAQIDMAEEHGVDVFEVSTRNDTPSNAYMDNVLHTMVDAAETHNNENPDTDDDFALAAYIESIAGNETATVPQYMSAAAQFVQASIEYNADTYGDRSSYLKVDGRPVMFIYQAGSLSPETWQTIITNVRAHCDPDPYLVADFIYTGGRQYSDYLQYFDGMHIYNPLPFVKRSAEPYAASYSSTIPDLMYKQSGDTKGYSLLTSNDNSAQKLWMGTVLPGEFPRVTGFGVGGVMVDRFEGDTYKYMWNAALSREPDWIMISTWNEYIEDTQITSTNNYGDFYLNLTQDMSSVFKSPTTTERASLPISGVGERGNSQKNPSISSDTGRYVVFETAAPLVDADTNGLTDIYRLDTTSDSVDLVSAGLDGKIANDNSHEPTISADGNLVAFSSLADNLVNEPGNVNDPNDDGKKCLLGGSYQNCADIFVKDMSQPDAAPFLVSTDSAGNQANMQNVTPAISDDGEHVVFSTAASNLTANDSGGRMDVFMKDLVDVLSGNGPGATRIVSATAAGVVSNNNSITPSVSSDGTYVAFASSATNLATGTTGYQVYVKDMSYGGNGALELASTNSNGIVANSAGTLPSISDDGGRVAFASTANNLVSNDSDSCSGYGGVGYQCRDVFVKDRGSGTTLLVSRSQGRVQGNGESHTPVLSGDGHYVAFASLANNLVSTTDDPDSYGNKDLDVFRKKIVDENGQFYDSGAVDRLSLTASGGEKNVSSGSFGLAICGDGNQVAFNSRGDLLSSDSNGVLDLYIRNLSGAGTELMAHPGGMIGGQTDADSDGPTSVSKDGRYTVFQSDAANLIDSDINSGTDVFLRDNWTNTVSLVSTSNLTGAHGNGRSYNPSISQDGKYVVFVSEASNLVQSDNNGKADIFVKEVDPKALSTTNPAGKTVRVSTKADGGESTAVGASDYPSLAGDDDYVSFVSAANDLVGNDTNDAKDVFRKRIRTSGSLVENGEIIRASVSSANGQSNGDSDEMTGLSADGRYVVFTSSASNIVEGDTNSARDVFVRDCLDGTNLRVSTDSDGLQSSGGDSYTPTVSNDGLRIAFVSEASNLDVLDTDIDADVFVKQLDEATHSTGTTSLVSSGILGAGNGSSDSAKISADGRHVVFASTATNLVSEDTDNLRDIYVKDLQASSIELITLNRDDVGESESPSISTNGRKVAFASTVTNLVPGDSNSQKDIFIVSRQAAYEPTIDNALPSGWINAGGELSSDFTGNYVEGTGSVAVDGVIQSCTQTTGHISCQASSLVPGHHTFVVSVKDTSGVTALFNGAFDLDASAPDINEVSPAGSIGTMNPTLYVTFEDLDPASGINTASAEITLDGVSQTGCTVEETSASCPASNLLLGDHVIGGHVSDNAGNTAQISGGFSVADTVAPVFGASWPAEGSVVTTSGTSILVDYWDEAPSSGIDVNSIHVYLDDQEVSGCVSVGSQIQCTIDNLTVGSHHFDANISDLASPTPNQGSKTVTFSVADTQAPVFGASWPAEGSVLTTAETTLSVDYWDEAPSSGIDVNSIHVYLDDQEVSGCVSVGSQIQCTIDNLTVGSHHFDANISDLASPTPNQGSKTVTFSVADTQAPVFGASWPAEGSVLTTAETTLSVDFWDAAPTSGINLNSYHVYIDDVELSGCSLQNNNSQIQCPVSGLSVGAHHFDSYISDMAPNQGSKTVAFSRT